MSHYSVTLLLGSNLGDTQKNIESAIMFVNSKLGEVILQTPLLYSDPVEFGSTNIFCNIAILIKTEFSPLKLLNMIKEIEREMGRIVDSSVTGTYADRVIDIDIVMFENILYECKTLQIPHQKHLYYRDFSRYLLQTLNTLKTQI
ncbi:MAG: 2-amino-4-hydroxy-6-hydroxymethyldihydropteridine diphosphokinase [Kaistella sp.]